LTKASGLAWYKHARQNRCGIFLKLAWFSHTSEFGCFLEKGYTGLAPKVERFVLLPSIKQSQERAKVQSGLRRLVEGYSWLDGNPLAGSECVGCLVPNPITHQAVRQPWTVKLNVIESTTRIKTFSLTSTPAEVVQLTDFYENLKLLVQYKSSESHNNFINWPTLSISAFADNLNCTKFVFHLPLVGSQSIALTNIFQRSFITEKFDETLSRFLRFYTVKSWKNIFCLRFFNLFPFTKKSPIRQKICAFQEKTKLFSRFFTI